MNIVIQSGLHVRKTENAIDDLEMNQLQQQSNNKKITPSVKNSYYLNV